MTKIFIVEDHELMRLAVREAIAKESDMELIGEASTAREAMRRLPLLAPDVALLDIRLPDGNGIEICREVRSLAPGVRCLIVTQHDDDQAVVDAVVAGAVGYVTKGISVDALMDAIRRIGRGETLLSGDAVQRAVGQVKEMAAEDERTSSLTPTQQKVLDLIGEGMSNREIAEHLHLAEQTVKNYVSRILTRLGMRRRTEAAVFSARQADEKRRFN